MCFALGSFQAKAQNDISIRAGILGNGKVNGAEFSAARNVFADKENKLVISAGVRFSVLNGKFEAVNELAIRENNDALKDELKSFDAAFNSSANLFIGCMIPMREKWIFRAEGDLIGVGFGSAENAAFVSGEALKSSRPQFAMETIEISGIQAQSLNLFVPINRSRGTLNARIAADYRINENHTLSAGFGLALRGFETQEATGAKGSTYFRQTSYLPYVGYVWNLKKGK